MLHSTNFSANSLPRSRARADVDMPTPYLDCAVFLFLPTILNLSSVRQLAIPRIIISLLFIALLLKNIFVYSAVSGQWAKRVGQSFLDVFNVKNRTLMFFMILVALFTISEIRAAFNGVYPFSAFFGTFLWMFGILFYLLSVVALNRTDDARRMLIVSLVCGLGVFVSINVVAYLLGLRGFNSNEDVGQNRILSYIGISMLRVALPFASGVNNFGSIAGLAIVAGIALVKYSRGNILAFAGSIVAALGLFGAVLVDSRASIGIAILVCILMLLSGSSKKLPRGLRLLPLFVFLAPVLIYGLNALLSDTGIAELVTRQGAFAQRLGLLTGRDLVWESAFNILGDMHPVQLVGYGAVGQFTSGAAKGYAWIFSEYAGVSQHSLHNANLQILFDIGYIGLVIWLVFWFFLMSDISKNWGSNPLSIDAGVPVFLVIFVLLGGIFEVSGTPIYPDIFVMVIFLVAWSLRLPGVALSRRNEI